MRQAQITLFMIVGIVMLLTIGLLFAIIKSVRPELKPVLNEDEKVLAKTCLAQSTRVALRALEDDGIVSVAEGGTLDEKSYFYVESPDKREEERNPSYTGVRIPFGKNNYLGLCDTEGPNRQSSTGYYLCDTNLYQQLPEPPSIQEQLLTAITERMAECLEINGVKENSYEEAEVIMQPDSILVRWPSLSVTHTEYAPLVAVWRGIQEAVVREVTESNFDPVSSPLECAGCEDVSFVKEDNKGSEDWDIYEVLYDGTIITRVFFRDRDIIYIEDDSTTMHINETYTFTCDGEECRYDFFTVDNDLLNLKIISGKVNDDKVCNLKDNNGGLVPENPDCEAYTDSNSCTGSCKWDDFSGACSSDPKELPCYATVTQEPVNTQLEDELTVVVTPGCKDQNTDGDKITANIESLTNNNHVMQSSTIFIFTEGQNDGLDCVEVTS